MIDLRQDFVIRLLQEHPRPYVARVTGISASTLYLSYKEYFAEESKTLAKAPQDSDAEFKLWKLIQEEGTSAEGLALWMAWKLEMPAQEIVALTWDQVDLVKGIIKLQKRNVKIGGEFLTRLKTVKGERAPDSDPHILLTPRAQKGFDAMRLSRVMRNALIRGGVDMTLQDILNAKKRNYTDYPIVKIVEKYGSATRNKIMKELSLSQSQFYTRTERLVERGELVRVGQKLYLPGTVVAPEEQYEVIRAHLETVPGAVRGDLAKLLHVSGNQCSVILKALVEEGKLEHTGHVYSLPDKDKNM
jgi:Mn-dependent DtxR family transcriptional regulator